MSKWNLNNKKIQENMSLIDKIKKDMVDRKGGFDHRGNFVDMKDIINRTEGEDIEKLRRDSNFIGKGKYLTISR